MGKAKSVVVWSSPEGGANELKLLYLLAIAAARSTLDIQSPYLITDESTQWSLSEARRRGVRIRLLTEGDITDAKPVKFAGRSDYERLMEQGIEVYEYQPAMMHTKAMVVDGVLSIVGSANFDNRSLELNDELNVAVFDPGLAGRITGRLRERPDALEEAEPRRVALAPASHPRPREVVELFRRGLLGKARDPHGPQSPEAQSIRNFDC